MQHRLRDCALILTMLLGPLGSPATSATIVRPAGSIGVFFDTIGEATRLRGVEPLEASRFWVLAIDPPGGMLAFEFALDVPQELVVTARWLCVGCTSFPARGPVGAETKMEDNYIIGTSGVCFGTPGTWVLVECRWHTLTGPVADLAVCLHGATPSSFPSRDPGYLTCGDPATRELRTFVAAYNGCAVINPTAVPVSALDWSTLKSRYWN